MEEETYYIPVSRFEIIDHRKDGEGRIFVTHGDTNVQLSLQDDDHTLKIFLTDGKEDGNTNS